MTGAGRQLELLCGIVLGLGACSPQPNFAGLEMQPRRAEYRERMLMQTLGNGLRVLVVPDSRSNLVMVGVHYAVGGSDDPSGADGLAHYVEHVLFEAAYRGPDGLALRDIGLDANAFTSFDRTFFYLVALDAELAPALEITARRFETACDDLDPAVLARERDVVIEEEKTRSPQGQISGGLLKAIWGAAHPYGRNVGGHGFASLQRPALCKFIDEHYGPASAVLVVAGNVHDADVQRIRSRFDRIPARATANRSANAGPIKTSRVVVNDLEKPTALLAFPAPGAGTAADAALAAIDGRVWRLEGGAPARSATTIVVGEQRERAIVAIAEVADAKHLDELLAAMQRSLKTAKVSAHELEMYRQRRRTVLAAQLDDTFAYVPSLAASVARGERPTRFRDLQLLDQLKPDDLTRWFAEPGIRAAFLLPQVGATGKRRATEIATELHDVDIPRGAASGHSLPSPSKTRPHLAVLEHRLHNGLRVLLAPDPEALAMDARLVIEGTRDETASGLDVDAAELLTPDAGNLPVASIVERLQWYATVGAPVRGRAGGDVTIFQIRGLTLYADWHVWNLAWTVLRGTYREKVIDAIRRSASSSRTKAPTTSEVVRRRLAGVTGFPDAKTSIHSASSLEAFRQARYRPERSTLIVSGNFDVDAMRKEIDTLFGEWQRGGTLAAYTKPPRVGSAVGIATDDEPTLEITLAFVPEKNASPSEAAARAVLDNMVDMRMRVVREQLGASYGVAVNRGRSALWIRGAVEPAYAGQAAKAIAEELERIRTGDASLLDDFARAKKRVLATALAIPLGASRRAEALQRATRDGGDIKQVDQQVETIRTLELPAVQQLAARELQPGRMITAVRGDKQAIEAALGALGIAKDKWEWFAPAKGKGRDPAPPAEMPRLMIHAIRGGAPAHPSRACAGGRSCSGRG